MGWPKKNRAAGPMRWEQDICHVTDVARTLGDRAARRWLTKHIAPLHDGTVLIVSMQSAEYAPKPAKVKKAKAEPTE